MLQLKVNYECEGMPIWDAIPVLEEYFNNGREIDLTDEKLSKALRTFDGFEHYEMQKILFGKLAERIYDYRKNGRQVL